jgi:hypothetical protein
MVTQLSGLDEMRDGEEGAENDADAADNHVGDTEEGVLAAHYSAGTNYYGFRAAVFGYVEICPMLEGWWGVKREEGRTYGDQYQLNIFPRS